MTIRMNVYIRKYNGIKNLYNNRIKIFLFLLILMPPSIVNNYETLDLLVNILRVIVSIAIFADYFIRGTISKFFLFEASIWLIYIIYCLVNHTWEYHVLVTVASILSLTALIESCFILGQEKCFYKGLQLLLYIYLIANFVTLMMIDLDMLRTTVVDADVRQKLFLGFDNDAAIELIPLMGVLLCLGGRKGNFAIFFLAFIEFVITASGSGMLLFFILFVYYFAWNHVELPRWIRSWSILLFFGVIFILVYYFQIQNLFSFLIINILGKDLSFTSRTYIWRRVLKAVKNSWLIGYGNFTYSQLYASQVSALAPHNIFLYFFLMGGIIGFILFAFIIIYSFNKIDKQPRYVNMNNTLLVTLFCYLLCGIVASYYSLENFSMLLCVANQVGSNNVLKQRNR